MALISQINIISCLNFALRKSLLAEGYELVIVVRILSCIKSNLIKI